MDECKKPRGSSDCRLPNSLPPEAGNGAPLWGSRQNPDACSAGEWSNVVRRCASRSATLSQLRSLFGKRLSCPRPQAPGGSCEQGTVGARGAARQRHVNRVPYWEKRPAFTSDLGRIKSPPSSRSVSDTYWDHGWRRALRSQDAIRRDLCAAWARTPLTLSACLPIFAAWAIHCASPEERRRVSTSQFSSRQRDQCKFTPVAKLW